MDLVQLNSIHTTTVNCSSSLSHIKKKISGEDCVAKKYIDPYIVFNTLTLLDIIFILDLTFLIDNGNDVMTLMFNVLSSQIVGNVLAM